MIEKKEITLKYTSYSHFSELENADIILVEKALNNLENAYAPYSKFKVSALVLLSNKEIILGTNQENIAYPSGICAERVALFYAKSTFPNEKISTLIVVSKGELIAKEDVISPCGSCRQVISEYENLQNQNIRIILVAASGTTIEIESNHCLLPFTFKKN